MKLKVSKLHLVLYMNFMIVFNAQLIPFKYRLPFEVMAMLYIASFVISNIKMREVFNCTFYCLVGITTLSVVNFFRGNITERDLIQCIIQYVGIILLYDVFMIFHKRHKDLEMIQNLRNILLFYTIINIISVCAIGIDEQHNLVYMFGNKFRVGYYIIYLIGLIYCLNYGRIKKNILYKFLFIFFSIIAMLYMYYITCKTTVVALAFFFVMSMLIKKDYKVLSNTYLILICTLASGFVILGIESIISLPIVQNVIHLLNEDVFLNGRTRIYSMYLFPLLEKAKYIGYGYGNTAMWNYSTVFGNAQNGMFDFILNNGIIGLLLHFVVMFFELHKDSSDSEKYGLFLILYAMLIIAIVEVTFGVFVFTIVFIIRWYDPGNSNEADTEALHKRIFNIIIK